MEGDKSGFSLCFCFCSCCCFSFRFGRRLTGQFANRPQLLVLKPTWGLIGIGIRLAAGG